MENLSSKIYDCFSADTSFDMTQEDILKQKLADLQPLSENELLGMESYDDSFEVRFVFNSNSIEGSTLTEPETALVLEGEFVPDRPGRDYFAARGSADGMAYYKRALSEGRELTEDLIKDIHERTALDCQPATRGRYREHSVYIRGSKTPTADHHEISLLMKDIISAYENSSQHEVYKAFAFHAMFEHIHPFADGNGRSGRLLLNYMLEKAGYPPICIKYDLRADYYQGLENWQVLNDPELFVNNAKASLNSELENRIKCIESSN